MAKALKITELFRETISRAKLDLKKVNLRCLEFSAQNKAIDDPSQLKAYNCTRRAGKSVTVAIDFTESAQAFPKTNYLYMALTIGSAREILWDVLRDINEKGVTGAKFNESRLEVKLPNGSKIKFAGADCSEKQMRKILGQKYKKVAIDEAGSFTIDMRRLVYQMVLPTLIDLRGQLILLGTCENIPLTFFEDVTEGKEPGWSVHKWDTRDNPFMAKQWEDQIADMKRINPNVIYTSWFKTHYLNQWCADDDLMIVRLRPDYYVDKLPERKGYEYVLGVDLGFNDASAYSILAYHEYDKKCYVVKSWKKSGLTLTKVAQEIESIMTKYPIGKIKIDGANKQGVEDIKQRFKLNLESADKTEKAFFLKALNDDFAESNLLIVEKDNTQLITEWKQLQWEDEYKRKEDDRCQNHLSDATLYAWRECRHFDAESQPKDIPKNSDEYMDREEEREAELLQQQIQEERESMMEV